MASDLTFREIKPVADRHDISRFRTRRGRILSKKIDHLTFNLKRPIRILDLGGHINYWKNIDLGNIAHIVLLNNEASELTGDMDDLFSIDLGDACHLSQYADKSFDLVHSNSVIEHVGLWPRQHAMAREAMRVGHAGWIQTPAFEFPIEPHHRVPFVHWFGSSIQRALLRLRFPDEGVDGRRNCVDLTNLLSHVEMKALFPGCAIHVERFALLKKSFTAHW
jgi:hypothetical protein